MSVKNQVGIKKIIIEKPFFIISGNHISPAIIRFSSFNPMYKTATKLQKVYQVIVFCCCCCQVTFLQNNNKNKTKFVLASGMK
jgi:hypothetical protein